ncbi:MAG: PilZ domain-containing protein, partial [Bryobacteraceae bacterium]
MVCSVDRRLHNRALADLDVEVVRLSNKDHIVPGKLEDISESGMCLILPCELAPEEIVRLETADCTLYGHVVHCTWQRNAFRTGIEVQRVLVGNTDLAELLRTALQDT